MFAFSLKKIQTINPGIGLQFENQHRKIVLKLARVTDRATDRSFGVDQRGSAMPFSLGMRKLA